MSKIHESEAPPRRLSASEMRRLPREERRRILAEHTYDHRAAQVEAVLGLEPAGARVAVR